MIRIFRVLCFLLVIFPFALFAQPSLNKEKVTLEDIWVYYRYYPRQPSEFRWMKDDNYYSVLEEEQRTISRFSITDAKKVDEVLSLAGLDLGGLQPQEVQSYEFSADESQILLMADAESIYRHSSREVCFVVNRNSRKVQRVMDGQKISNATFSPDGTKLGFVFENNLYYMDAESGKTVQVTSDGLPNHIINGAADWVYEEEFAFAKAFTWSPDGNRIAFYRFDETEVPEFVMPVYGSLYPEQQKFKYPKAGEKNAVVSIHVYDLAERKTVMADMGSEKDQYIPRIKWTHSSDQLAVMRLNRLQNQVDVLLINADTGQSTVVLSETSDTYIEEATDGKWFFLKDSEDFLWLSEMDGYNHIYLYGRDGKVKKALTKGNYEVSQMLGVDEVNGLVYFLSKEVSPRETHLYSVRLDGKKKTRLTQAPGVHDPTFSSAFNYYVDNYSSVTQPGITELCNKEGNLIKTLEDNHNLQERVKGLAIKTPEFFSFKTEEGVELDGWMLKPRDFSPDKKYPVLMFVYGGPGDQQVLDAWGNADPFNYMWHQMLTQNGYIVACVDNRGTGGKGRDFRDVTYANMGKYETIDQIEAAKYFARQSYVDGERIGIWGWSYGGYMTSLCMTKGKGIFKAGIAVSPVTNWRFYDTIYTERYLKTPQLNPGGYDDNSPINFAGDLEGAYLLVHGTADDNVHVQNSMEWVDALVAANKQFEMFFYPNRNHGIYGGYTRYHLYRMMTEFIYKNL
ncbi:MAG: S9 family peptidase [Bacteroidia bacterium]|nr:S9 family peptidase [Bacteroidia bacterium]